jgi:hypothetical protein
MEGEEGEPKKLPRKVHNQNYRYQIQMSNPNVECQMSNLTYI